MRTQLTVHEIRASLENGDYISSDLTRESRVTNRFSRLWIQLKKRLGMSKEYRISEVARALTPYLDSHLQLKHESPTVESLKHQYACYKTFQLLSNKVGLRRFTSLFPHLIQHITVCHNPKIYDMLERLIYLEKSIQESRTKINSY